MSALLQVAVIWSASIGTISSGGLYTAPPNATGTATIAASAMGKQALATVMFVSGAAVRSMAFGPYHVPPDSLGRPGFAYSGGQLNGDGNLLANLRKVQAAHGRVVISLLRSKTKDTSGRLSVAATRANLATWPDLRPFINDGTILGVVVSDDITSATIWGGEVPPLARIDSLAREVKARWPAHPIARATPNELKDRKWAWLDAAWCQYNGPFRNGTPQSYRDTCVSQAKALHLGLVLGLNVLDGGCGAPTTACLSGVPGSYVWGTYVAAPTVRRYQMSGAEVEYYGTVFAQEPYNCAVLTWQWSPDWSESGRTAGQVTGIQNFDKLASVRAASAKVRAITDSRTPRECGP